MAIVREQQPIVGVAPACHALAIPRASYYRWRKPKEPVPVVRQVPRALPPEERERILAVLHSDRFADLPPAEVYATLLDEGTYLCSVRTMYRILQDRPRCASGAVNCGIRTTRRRSSWPPARIRSGRGTSPSFWAR